MIKKMGLRKLRAHEAANRFLQEHYVPEHNKRFARSAAQPQDIAMEDYLTLNVGSDTPPASGAYVRSEVQVQRKGLRGHVQRKYA